MKEDGSWIHGLLWTASDPAARCRGKFPSARVQSRPLGIIPLPLSSVPYGTYIHTYLPHVPINGIIMEGWQNMYDSTSQQSTNMASALSQQSSCSRRHVYLKPEPVFFLSQYSRVLTASKAQLLPEALLRKKRKKHLIRRREVHNKYRENRGIEVAGGLGKCLIDERPREDRRASPAWRKADDEMAARASKQVACFPGSVTAPER